MLLVSIIVEQSQQTNEVQKDVHSFAVNVLGNNFILVNLIIK